MAKTWRYWINPIFIFCWGYLVIFGSLYQTLFQSSFLKFLFLFTLLIPIPVFLQTLQWTDFLPILGWSLRNQVSWYSCWKYFSALWRLLISSFTAACGDLLPQYLSPGGLFYVNILVKQICDKEEKVKRLVKSLVFS